MATSKLFSVLTFLIMLFVSVEKTEAQTNYGLSFNGSGTVSLPETLWSKNFNSGSAITVEYWFKGSVMSSVYRVQDDSQFFVAGWSSGKHIISTDGGIGGVSWGNSSTVHDENWHHIALTWSRNGNFTSYVDGVQSGQRATAANVYLPIMNTTNYLGSYQGTGEFISGQLDEVRIWNVVRTASEISDNKSKELIGNETGLVAYYKMNAGSGTVLADHTSHAYNGTLTAGVSFTTGSTGINPTPSIIATGSLVQFLTTPGVVSASQSFNVSGANLSNIITISAPTGFEISNSSGSGYAGSLTLTPTSGSVANTTIYTRLSVSATGTPSGNIAVASTGASTQNIAVSGIVGSNFGLSFNGSGTVTLPATLWNNNFSGGSAITVEYWYKGTSSNSVYRVQDGSGNFFVAGYSNGKHIISSDGGVNGVSCGLSSTVLSGNWHHLAVTWSKNGNFTSYVDGIQSDQRASTANATLPSTNSISYLGSLLGESEWLTGQLDEIRIWKVARTATEISANINKELIGNETGLVAYYKMNQCTGTSLTDNTVNGYNGTLTSGVSWVPGTTGIVTTPSISTSGPLSSFTACAGIVYANQSFTASGVFLTDNITITAPTGFEISTASGSGFGSTLTLTPSSGSVANTTVYVRLTALATGTPSGNIALASTNATTKNVAVSGSVTDNVAIGSQSTAAKTQCAGGTFTAITVNATGASLTYQWFRNTNETNSGGTTLGETNGAQTNSYTPQSATAGTLYYYCVVTGTCGTPQSSAVSGAFVTNAATAIGNQSTEAQSQCVGGTFTAITVTATGASFTYQWFSNANETNSGGTTLGETNGAQTNSYTPQSATVGTLYYYCVVTGTCGTATSTISGAFVTNAATAIGSQSTEAQSQCAGGTFTAITVAATGASFTYQWFSNANETNSGGTTLGETNGAQTNSYTPQSATVGTLYYYCVVSGTCGTPQTSTVSGAFVTNMATAIGSQSTAGQTQFTSGTFTPITVTATGTNITYQWFRNTSATNSGGTTLGEPNGAQTNSYTPQSANSGTLYYYCVVTGTCGTVTSAVSGEFVVNIVVIAPTSQASTIVFSNVSSSTMTVGWTIGNGTKRTVFVKAANTGSAEPADNSTYTASTVFVSGTQIGATGWYCIYNGAGTSAAISGLTASTAYVFQVFEYNGSAGSEKYLASTASNNPKSQTTGIVFNNYAIQFDGANDYVTIPDNNSLDLTTNYTIEAWIKPSSFVALSGIVSKYMTAGANGYDLRFTNSGSSSSGISFDEMSTANGLMVANTWYHIAAVNNGGTRIVYINGVSVPLTGFPTTVIVNSDPVRIGSDYSSRYFTGNIDEVRIWNVVRTSQQILDNKNIELSGSETGLVAYYKMSNGSGTTLSDNKSTGTANNGTLTNGPLWVVSDALMSPFVVNAPTNQASTIVFSNVSSSTMTVGWTNGNGSKRAVFVKQASTGTVAPADNSTYTANTIFGSGTQIGATGWYCIYNGTGTSVAISGLTTTTDYIFQVFEYNGPAGSEMYLTSSASNNPKSQITSENINYAIQFDGTDDHVTIPDNNALDLTTNYTIEAWIKPSSFVALSGIVSKYQNFGSNGYDLRFTNNGSSSSGISFDEMGTANGLMVANTWYHIAAVNNGGTRIVYINGVFVPLTGTATNVIANTDPVRIGSDYSSRYFTGNIDEVRIWNVVRTSQQISDNKSIELTGNESGLVAYYKMSNGSGTTLSDNKLTGTALNGTLTNGPVWVVSDALIPPVVVVAPTSQANTIVFSNVATTSMTVGWTNGNGSKRAVFVKAANTGATTPIDNTTYTANAAFGSGTQIGTSAWYCVYNGTSNSVNMTGLVPETNFIVQVIEYNGSAGSEKYQTATATDNPKVQQTIVATPSVQANMIVYSNVATTSMTIGWTIGNGAKRAVFVKQANTGTAAPIDNSTYIANTALESGTQISTSGWYCVFNGTSNSVNITGLVLETDYIVQVVEYNGPAGSEKYLATSATNNPMAQKTSAALPTGQANTIVFSNVATTSMTIGWTNGNGIKRAVFVKSANTGTAAPTDNSTYTANTTFGGGSQVGATGWYCISNGTSNSVSMTGLLPETNYMVQVVEYNGSAGYEKYLTTSVTDNPKVQQTSVSTPTTQANTIVFSNVASTTMTIGWTNGYGVKRAVFVKQANTGTATPIDNSTYTSNTAFGSGTQIGTSGWYCVYNGTSNSVNMTGLATETNYIVQVIEYNGSAGSEKYLLTSATNNPKVQQTTAAVPTLQANTIVYSNVSTTSITIGWTIGNGVKRAVFVKAANTGTAAPMDNITYTANTAFGSGIQISTSGWYCIYNGTSNSVSITGLAPETNYIAHVVEYNGSAGSEKYLITSATDNPKVQQTLLASPTVQANTIVFSNVSSSTMTIGWTNGNGSKRAVFVKLANTGTAIPIDNSTYTANAAFGSGTQIGTSGWYCVYNGTSNIVNITGLVLETNYIVQVIEYNGLAGSEKYLTSAATDNPKVQQTTSVVPTVQANTIVFSNVATTSFTVGWTNGNGVKRAVFMKAANTGTAAPADYSTYTANATFGSGTQIGATGWYCIYNGTSNSVSMTGLVTETNYIVQVIEYNGSAGSEKYLTTSATDNPKVQQTTVATPMTQATSNEFSNVASSSMTVGWTIGNGAKRAVFVKQANTGTASPTDNSTYTANTAYGIGTQIGVTGWYCVYNGTGTSVGITGLTASTDYIFQVFDYNGSAGVEKYMATSASNNPKSQTTGTVSTNYAIRFDGTNDFVVLPDNLYSSNLSGGTAITIEYWFKGTQLQSAVRFQDSQWVVAGWGGTNPQHIISPDGLTNGVKIESDATIEDNAWHHIAMTWQSNTTNGFKTYVDGVLMTGTGFTRTSANVKLPIISKGAWLGAQNGSEPLNGILDEVRVWNIVRTEQQIADNKNFELVGSEAGLVAYYKMTNGNGATLSDNKTTGTAYNGTLTNGPTWVTGAPVSPAGIVAVPTNQASTIVFSNVAGTSTTLGWTNGNGVKRAVFMKAANTGTAAPVNNTTYTANTALGSGTQIGATEWYCVYNGTSNSLNVTGLTQQTNYIVQVFEYNGSAGTEKYLTSTSTDNPKVQETIVAAPTVQANTLAFSSISPSSTTLGWSIGNGTKHAVFAKAANTGTAVPIDNSTYSASTTFGNGAQIGSSGWFCVYNGTGTSAGITGLTASTDYIFQVFEYNGPTGSEKYLASSGTSNPKTTTTTSSSADYALSFDGSGDYVSFEAPLINGNFEASSNAITIEYWFKGSVLQSAVRRQSGGAYIVAGWKDGSGSIYFVLSNDGGTTTPVKIGTETELQDGKWHHIAVSWKTNTANGFRTYVDGVLKNSRSSSMLSLPTFTSKTFYLGGFATLECLNGLLDEVRIWNIVRTDEQIAQSKSSELSGNETGLIAYYKMSNGSGTTLTDNKTIGTVYNGTLQSETHFVTPGVPYNVPCISPDISSQSTATQTQLVGGAFTPITVTATGTNLTYQWYRNSTASNSGGTSLVSNNGANTRSYTPQTSVAGTLYYYCTVGGDCGTRQTSLSSEAFIVNTAPAYCTPPASIFPNQGYISNMTVTDGLTNFNNSSEGAATSYTDYSATKSASQVPGGPVSISFTSFNNSFSYAVWIDFNDDGTFSPAEKVVSRSNQDLSVITGFNVPADAPLGSHRMRVKADHTMIGVPGDPCDQLNFGETEDYTFTVVALQTGVLAYCAPPASIYSSSLNYISNVATTGGLTNFDNASASAPSSYANFSATKSASQTVGSPVTMNFTSFREAFIYAVWIDFNDDGSFATDEKVISLINVNLSANKSFTVPVEAKLGPHRMRVRGELISLGLKGDPCNQLQRGETEDYTFTVVAPCFNPAIGSQSTVAQMQCISGTFTPITVTATGSNLAYQWYSNATASNSGGTSLGSANGAKTNSYKPQAITAGTLYYYCVVTGDCGSPQTSAVSGAFVTNQATAIGSQSTTAQTQCINGTFAPITVTATGTNLSYQWYSNATASNSGGTSLGSANESNTNSYTPQATTAGTLYYYCIVTGDCGTPKTSAVSGAFVTNIATTVGYPPSGQTQCEGGTFVQVAILATGTNLTYQWYSNTTESNSGGTSLGASNGAQTNRYIPQSATAGTLYYYCVVTGTCGTVTSAVSRPFVTNPATVIGSQSTASQTRCANGTFNPITVTATGLNLTYQWYSNASASNSGGTSLGSSNGAQTNSYTPPSATIGTLYYYCVVAGDCGTTRTSAVSDAFVTNQVTAISSQSTATQTLAKGATFSPITVTATGTNLTYQWYSNTSESNISGNSLGSTNGANTRSYTPQSSTTGSLYYYCVVGGDCGTPQTSAVSGVFSLYCTPSTSVQPCTQAWITNVSITSGLTNLDNTSACNATSYTDYSATKSASQTVGSQVSMRFTSSGSGLNYAVWIDSNDDGIFALNERVISYANESLSLSVSTSFIVPSEAKSGPHRMRVRGESTGTRIPDDPCSQLTNGETEDYSFTTCVGPAIGSQSTAAQTQCANGTFTPITISATGTNLTYQWYKNVNEANSGGTSLVSANGANTNSYTPQASVAGTLYYYCVVTGDCGTPQTCAVSGAFVTNQATVIGSQSTAAQTLCINGTFSPITVTATGLNVTFQWYSNSSASNSGGTSLGSNDGAQSNSYTPQSEISGTLYYYCVVTGTCGTATSAVSGTFITNPVTAIVSQSTAAQSLCVGVSFAPITVTVAGANLTYQWYSNSSASNSGGTSLGSANGANTSSYTPQRSSLPLYYYCIVKGDCGTSQTSAVSGVFLVYCTPQISSSLSYYITNVTTTICETNFNNNSGVPATSYTDYSTTKSASQTQGNPVNISITSNWDSYCYSIWIDFNDDGTFAPSEKVVSKSNFTLTLSTGFNVPVDAKPGPHRMRIRGSQGITGIPNDPCDWLYYGCTQDYTFIVNALPQGTLAYCAPPTSTSSGNYYIANVATTGGLTNFDNTSVCALSSYANFSSTSSASQAQGSSVTMSFTSIGTPFKFVVWIDFNDDGTFKPSEIVIPLLYGVYSAGSYSANKSFTLPSEANPGTHRMRVRGVGFAIDLSDPCIQFAYGETEDYLFTVVALPSGVPTIATTDISTISAISALSGGNITFDGHSAVTSRGVCWNTTGSPTVSGSKTTDASGMGIYTSSMANLAFGATYYVRAYATNEYGTGYGREKSFKANYCIPPTSKNPCTYYISNVATTDGLTNFDNTSACAATSFTDYSATKSFSQTKGESVTMRLTSVGTSFGYGVWIDFNNDGTFDFDEMVISLAATGRSVTTGFSLPLNAPVGPHRMRIRGLPSGYTIPSIPCNQYPSGETEDYTFTVVALASGVPAYCAPPTSKIVDYYYISNVNTTGGLTNFDNATVCSVASFANFSATKTFSQTQGEPVAIGLTSVGMGFGYIGWIDYNDDGTFANDEKVFSKDNFAGNLSVTTGFSVPVNAPVGPHRMRIRGGNYPIPSDPCNKLEYGETEDYTFVVIALASGVPAYCAPPTSSTVEWYYISKVSTTGGLTNFDNTSALSPSSFANFSATKSASQIAGSQVTINFTSAGNAFRYAVWIDFNDDGTFASGEKVLSTTEISYSTSKSFTVPADANSGPHRMRVRGESTLYQVPTDPCTQLNFGETEDYTFTVCILPAIVSQSTATQTKCTGEFFSPITITATGTNLTYQWYSNTSDGNSGGTSLGSVNGAATSSYTPQTTTAGTLYYYCTVTGDCGTPQTSSVSEAFITNQSTGIESQSTAIQTQCANGIFTPITVTATGPNLTYQWYSNLSAVNSGGTSLGADNGAQINSYTPQSAETGTKYYYCIVTGTYSVATSAVSGAVITNETTTIDSQSTATQTQFTGGLFSSITVTATGASLSYQWYSNATGTNSGGNSLGSNNGANTSSYTPQTSTTGTKYYYCMVSGTCGTTQTSAVSEAFVVNPATIVVSQSTDPQTKCANGIFDPITVTATGPNLTYQWFSNITEINSGGISLGTNNGAQTNSYTPQSATAGTQYYYCVVTGTYATATSAVSGAFVTNLATAIGSQSTASQTQNAGGIFTPITVTATGANLTYQWYSNAGGTNSGGTSLGSANGAKTSSYTPQTSTSGTKYYYCVVGGDCGSAQTSAVSGPFIVFCVPSASRNICYGWITNVTTTGGMTNFDNTSECTASSYTDYSAIKSVSQAQAGSVAINFTSDGNASAFLNYGVWIDYNDDGIFAPGEKVISKLNVSPLSLTVSANITVPTDVPSGPHRMRISGDNWANSIPNDPCIQLGSGETEDYTFTVIALPPSVPFVSTTVVSEITSTNALSGGNVAFDGHSTVTERGVCWNTGGTPTVSDSKTSNGTGNGSYESSITNLAFGTTYYVKAYATNEYGTGYGEEKSFTATYCIPPISLRPCTQMWITNVTTTNALTNFINSSDCAATSYADYSATKSASQAQGSQVTMSFTSVGSGFSYAVWIDFNDDGTFAPGENVISKVNVNLSVNVSFTVPANAALGSHRMRVRGDYWNQGIPENPCIQLEYGETEDYTFTVVAPCFVPNIASQSLATQTQCIDGTFTPITVTATGTNITYQWYWNISGSNSGGTSLVTANGADTYSYLPQTLKAVTLYYYCVVSGECGTSQTSAVSGAFIVNTCLPEAPTSLVATPGNGSVSISFTAGAEGVSAITNYEYSADDGITWADCSPTTTITPLTITGLTNGTTYPVKLRAVNMNGSGAASLAVSATPLAPTCADPTNGGAISGDQTGNEPFDPVAFTSSSSATGHTGTLEYKWQSSTTSGSTGFADIASSISETYDAGSLSVTTWFKRLARVGCLENWTTATESNVIQVTVVNFAAEPTAQPTKLLFSNTVTSGNTNIVVKYTASASATNYLVVRNTVSAPSFVPEDGTAYTSGSQGSDQIIFVGTATTATDLSITRGTEYFYTVFAFNGSGSTCNYLTTNPLSGSTSCFVNNTGTLSDSSGGAVTADFPDQGINISFPGGTSGTTITASKTTNAPASNFSVLPGVRGVANLYFTIISSQPSPGSYTMVLDFSSLKLTPTQWNSFKVMKRTNSSAPWVDIATIGGTITNRCTDGVYGKLTVTGLRSFSDFAVGEEAIVHIVTSVEDTGAGTLKQCIADAVAGDFINFNVLSMGSNTIKLASPVVIDKDLTIQGATEGIVLSGNNVTRVLEISGPSGTRPVVRLEKLTIANGNDDGNLVGGVNNMGELTMVNCLVVDNTASGVLNGAGAVGGIFSNGNLTLINTTVAGNTGTLTCEGIGGLYCGGTLNLYNSVIYGNNGEYKSIAYSSITESYKSLFEESLDVLSNDNSVSFIQALPGLDNLFDKDPKFVGRLNNALHPYLILGVSPCVDAGNDVYSFDATDIRGGLFGRKLSKDDVAIKSPIDIGAYEWKNGSDPRNIFTWTGTATTDWNTAGNWQEGGIAASAKPTEADIIIVPNVENKPVTNALSVAPGGSLTINASSEISLTGSIENNGTIVIKSDPSGTGSLITGSNTTGTGIAMIERFMSNDEWHIISSPTGTQTISDFLTDNIDIPYISSTDPKQYGMMDYNTAENKWNGYFTDLNPYTLGIGKGYMVRVKDPVRNLRFQGVINASAITSVSEGWNCIGNPFPSAININTTAGADNFMDANATAFDPSYGALYFWDQASGNYVAFNNSNAIHAAVGQGFFMKVKTGVSTVSFTPEMQVHVIDAQFKAANIKCPAILLIAASGAKTISTDVKFMEGAIKGLDFGYDAGHFTTDKSFALYTKLVEDNGINFQLQCLPTNQYKDLIIPVGIDSKAGGEIVFTVQTAQLAQDCMVILEDKLTHTFTDLSKGSYKAAVAANTAGTGRFYLHTGDIISGLEDQVLPGKLTAYVFKDTELRIIGEVAGNAVATLYNGLGKVVLTKKLGAGKLNIIGLPNLSSGIYLLNIDDKGTTQTIKMMIR